MPDTTNSVDGHMSNLENIGAAVEPTASQLISKEPNPLPRQRSTRTVSSLLGELRERTAPLHQQVEALLRLPGAIRNSADYKDWLGRFLGLYDPLECLLATFSGWDSLGGEAAGPMWQSFRVALEEFGARQPRLCADVVVGAERTFCAMLVWFARFSVVKGGQP